MPFEQRIAFLMLDGDPERASAVAAEFFVHVQRHQHGQIEHHAERSEFQTGFLIRMRVQISQLNPVRWFHIQSTASFLAGQSGHLRTEKIFLYDIIFFTESVPDAQSAVADDRGRNIEDGIKGFGTACASRSGGEFVEQAQRAAADQ